jgi:hypothetical protein
MRSEGDVLGVDLCRMPSIQYPVCTELDSVLDQPAITAQVMVRNVKRKESRPAVLEGAPHLVDRPLDASL